MWRWRISAYAIRAQAYIRACEESLHVQEILMARNRPYQPNPYDRRNTAVQQSRNAAKAIGGAPSQSPKPRTHEDTGSTYDSVRAAVARQRGE